MENNENNVIIEVTEAKRPMKERVKCFVKKHKTKLIVGATALGTAGLMLVVNKLKNGTEDEEEVESYEVEVRPIESVETFEVESTESEEV